MSVSHKSNNTGNMDLRILRQTMGSQILVLLENIYSGDKSPIMSFIALNKSILTNINVRLADVLS